jgi:hypothetical protein
MTEFDEHVQAEPTGQALGLTPSEGSPLTEGFSPFTASSFALLEVLPVNILSLIAAQAASGNRLVTAACFTGTTLVKR